MSEQINPELDPLDGGNVTPTGEVIYLDAERQRALERPDLPMRENRPDGLGIRDKLAAKMSDMIHSKGTPTEDKPGAFPKIVSWSAEPVTSPMSKFTYKFLGFDYGKGGYTHVSVIPLNVDLSESSTSAIVPLDLMIAEIREAQSIAILDSCICRTNFRCEKHPHDFGCIFMGPNAKHAVEKGIGHMVSADEAVAHVLKARDLGLMGAADFVEGEQFIWGVKNNEMNRYRMFCFCCECCCLALKVLKEGKRDVHERYTSVGWQAVFDHSACVGCQTCAGHCPQECIDFRGDGKARNDKARCMGCSFCKSVCPAGAIKIKQTMPSRRNLNEHYLKEMRIDDGDVHADAVHVGL